MPGEWLSLRHKQVLIAAAQGLSTRETAKLLGLSYYTVEQYRGMVLAAFDARTMTQAVSRAYERGILPDTVTLKVGSR